MPKFNHDAEHDLQTRLAVDAFTRNYNLYPWDEEALAVVAVSLPSFGVLRPDPNELMEITPEQLKQIRREVTP